MTVLFDVSLTKEKKKIRTIGGSQNLVILKMSVKKGKAAAFIPIVLEFLSTCDPSSFLEKANSHE